MKYGIYRLNHGYWTGCGFSMERASAQWMRKPEAELKMEQMRADGYFVSIHPKKRALHGHSN